MEDNFDFAAYNSTTYRKFHEAYMINFNGTTAVETYFLIVPSFLNVFICISIIYFILPLFEIKLTKLYQYLIEFTIIVLPIVFWVTILSDYIYYIFLFLLCVSVCIVAYLYKYLSVQNFSKICLPATRRHFITNARSTVNIITGICILAVDFRIFPNRYAKTETFGFSLMDVGVGLYICSNALVVISNIMDHNVGFLQMIVKTFTSCIPLFILGAIRFVLTSELEYQSPVSEYGVHWNFFITLAVTKLLSTVIFYIISLKYLLHLSVFLILLHEYVLHAGLSEWVFSNIARNTFLTANREGLVSSLGYLSLYFLTTHFVMCMNLKDAVKFKDNIRLLSKMSVMSIIYLILVVIAKNIFGVSRRLANSGYILWIAFIASSMTTFYLAIELLSSLIFVGLKLQFDQNRIVVTQLNGIMSLILEAVNYNGLTFFLLANVLTGLINLTIHTLTVDSVPSLIIIITYIFVICAVMSAAYIQNIKLKFW